MFPGQVALRLDQAPPFSAPLRFFLTAPLFPVLASLLLAWHGPDILASRWTAALLAVTHLLTLGFLTQVMAGAWIQLLPVLAGSPVPKSGLVGAAVHVLLNAGTLALGAGLLANFAPLLVAGTALLAGAFALFLGAAGVSLARVAQPNDTVRAMRFALAALLVTVLLGLTLGLALGEKNGAAPKHLWADVHLAWGLIGWVGLLVIGVAYQVVPMFQLTPPYPRRLRRALVPTLFVLLAVWSAAGVLAPRSPLLAGLAAALLALGLAAFAATTLYLQSRRKRRVPDVTASFWRLAMAGLIAAALAWAAQALGGAPRLALTGAALMIVGFAASVIHGMLYKIVPFLAWLHLHSRRLHVPAPNMKEILPDRYTRPQFRVQLAAVVLLAAATLQPQAALFYPAVAALLLSHAWLGWNLLAAYRMYRRCVRAGVPRRREDGHAH